MNKINILLTISILSFIGMIGLFYLHFVNTPKLGYIDTNKVIANYQGAKDAKAQYDQKAVVWKANIDTLTKELEKTIAAFKETQEQLSSKEKALQEELIKTKRTQLITYSNSIEQLSQQEDQLLTQNVLKEVNQYLKNYGDRQNYKIILAATNMGNIVYGNDAIDLTDEVITGLNSSYSK